MENKKRNWRSLHLFVFLLFLLIGAVPAVAGNYVLLQTMRQNEISYRMRQVQSQLRVFTNDLSKNDLSFGIRNEVLDAELTQVASLYDGRVLVISKNYEIVKDTYFLDEGKLDIAEDVMLAFQGSSSTEYNEQENFFKVTLPITSESTNEVCGVLVAEVSTQTQYTQYLRLTERLQTLLILELAAIVPVALLLSLLIVSPFRKIRREMDQARSKQFDSTLSMRSFREIEEISDSYNELMQRLKSVDDSRQQFVSNVSHELKTPITSMKVLADSLLEQENVPNELYREFMGDIREEIERESKIIEDLLTLVRMDRANQELNIQTVDMNEFLESLMHRLKPLAIQKKLEFVLESFRPVRAEIDEGKFSLAISNMIENAIKYNRQEGFVRVTLNADFQYFYIKISDSGIGIPAEAQPHVFERFYRADKSRTRAGAAIGGTGLGLSISQDIILLHHGDIRLHSEEGVGSTFTLRVPLIYIAQSRD